VKRVYLGVAIPHFGRNLSRESVYTIAEAAERLEYDSIWTTDHVAIDSANYYPYGKIYESIATLAAAGAVTERVKIGTSIIVLPMRNAVLTAKQLATIDSLTDGRLIVGLGVGWCEKEFANLGASFRRRGRHMDEAIRLLRTVWSNERPAFRGEFYRIADAVFEPPPSQRGGPPIWIGGNSRVALKRAVKLADGWHPTGIHPDTFREMVALVPTEIQRSFTLSVRLTVELDGKGVREYTSPQGERRVILGGRESELSDYLSQYVKYGASHLVLYFGDTSPDKYVERMASFVRDVYPSVAT
jgi:probable F420-dependent oxidoreductase